MGGYMKKLLAIFLCLVICYSFTGCNNNTKIKNDEARTALEKVLNFEETFNLKNPLYDRVSKENLRQFHFPSIYNALNWYTPRWYSYIDFNDDGIDELLVLDLSTQYSLILRYDNGEVKGNVFKEIDIKTYKTDGTFSLCYPSTVKTVSRVIFDGYDCQITHLAYIKDTEKDYKLNGKTDNKKKVEEYIKNWEENTEIIKYTTIMYPDIDGEAN